MTEPRDFVCDGTCAGNELGDCSHERPPARPTTAPRLWAFFSPTGRLLTTTDYEAGLDGTEHGLSFHHIGPFTRVEYAPVVAQDSKPLRPLADETTEKE